MNDSFDKYRLAVAQAVGFALLVQAAFVALTFPLPALWNNIPLLNIDTPFHWYNMYVAKALSEQGLLFGYDPYFGAGHIGGLNVNVSARAPALIGAYLTPGVPTELVQKWFWALTAILAPACAPWAAGILRGDRATVFAASVLAIIMWWATASHWYYTAGMVSYVLICFASLPFAAIVIRNVDERHWEFGSVARLSLAAAGLAWTHSLFPCVAALLLIPHLAIGWRSLTHWRALLGLACIAVTTVALNLPWLVALQSTFGDFLGNHPYQQRVDPSIALYEFLGLWRGYAQGAKLYPALVFLSLTAALFAKDAKTRQIARLALITWAVLVSLAALGAALTPLKALQPNRFSLAAYVSLLPAAAIGIAALARILRQSGSAWQRLYQTVLAIAIGLPLGLAIIEVGRELSPAPIGHYGAPPPLVRGVGASSRQLIAWLREHTSTEGRVLFETSLGRVHDGAHMAGYYAIQSNREFVGGPYPFMFKTGSWDGVAFGRPVETLSANDFRHYIETYNVGWIVAHSDSMRRYLVQFPEIVQQAMIKEVALFAIQRRLSFFGSGNGRVIDRGINRLRLEQLAGGNILLKYHYVPGLRATNGASISPCYVSGVSQPFICLSGTRPGQTELSLR